MHVLLGFHTSVNSTLKQFSPTQNDESEAVRTIHIVCELFGPRGDERNGRREDWLCYTGLLRKVSSIPLYRGNRFNNLFADAVGMISHIDDIKTFINDYVENPNAKIRGVLQDLQNDGIVSNICAIAILSSIVTEAFWRLINDNSTNHFDLHQYFVPLQQALYHWSKDSTVLLNKDVTPLYSEYPHKTYDFLYEGSESCKSTLEKLSDSLLSIVNRQLVDHLDSGSAVSITEEDRLRTT